MTKPKHSELPWRYTHNKAIITAEQQNTLSRMVASNVEPEDFAIMSRAVNHHDKLIDILKRVISDDTATFTKAYDEANELLTSIESGE